MTTSFEQSTLRIQITQQLMGRINRLGLKPGDRLGTERELADEFGVSVRTVREAAGQLRAMGVLTSRRRIGLIVAEPDPAHHLGSILPVYGQSEDNIEELHRLRYVIELGAVDLAVKNISTQQLAKMEQLAGQFEELQAQGHLRQADRCEIEFHSLILEATGSKLVSGLHDVIVRYFAKTAEHPEIGDCVATDRKPEHRAICEALRTRDAEKVRRVLGLHLGVEVGA